MMKHKNLGFGALFIALGITLPLIVHRLFSSIGGKVILPMHIPIFLSAFFLPLSIAISVAVSVPVLSFLLTGMPPFPVFVVMIFEFIAYIVLIKILFKRDFSIRHIIFTTVISMIGGRIVYSVFAFLVAGFGFMPQIRQAPVKALSGFFATGIPGQIIQIGLYSLLVPRLALFFVSSKQNKKHQKNLRHISLNEIKERLRSLPINDGEYDLVIGIKRGGTVPATLVSYEYSSPLDFLTIRKYKDGPMPEKFHETPQLKNIEDLENAVNDKKILLVDDFTKTGETLKLAEENVRKYHPESIDKLTIVGAKEADYSLFEESECVKFPWED